VIYPDCTESRHAYAASKIIPTVTTEIPDMTNQSKDIAVLVLGAFLIASCVAVAHFAPTTFQAAFVQMRVLTALGGALLGTALPGIIGIEIKGIRAIGAASFVVLFFLFTPLGEHPRAAQETTNAAAEDAPVVDAQPTRAGAAAQAAAGAYATSAPPLGSVVNSPVCQGDKCNQSTTYYQQNGASHGR